MDNKQITDKNIAQRLRVLDLLDQLSEINLSHVEMEDALREMLKLILNVFGADRAWFLYPCDPDVPYWTIPMECTRPKWPGLYSKGVDMPMFDDLSDAFRALLNTNEPIQQGASINVPIPSFTLELFHVKSQLFTLIRPKIGDPWIFGIHHCEEEIIHDEVDIELFSTLAKRISDFLNIWISIRKIRESEERWKFAIEGSGDGMWDWNPQTDKAWFSNRWKEMLGYHENEIQNNGAAWSELLHPEDKDRVMSVLQKHLSGKDPYYTVEFRMRCKNGSWKWILARGKLVSRDNEGNPIRILGTHSESMKLIATNRDISLSKEAEQQLRIAAKVFEAHEGIIITNPEGIILRANRSFCNVSGYTPEEVIGKKPSIFRSGRHDSDFYIEMWKSLDRTGKWSGEIWNIRKNGEICPEHLTISAVIDDNGNITNYVAIYTDFTMDRAAGEQIKNLAFYDPLTKLPNRRLFLDRLNSAMSASERHIDYGAILLIDLDHFKVINDLHGHGYGDLLLKEVAVRIKSCIRDMDTVSRYGGDEFFVLLEAVNEDRIIATQKVMLVAEKIRANLTLPYDLKGIEFHCSSSIGISLFHGHEKPAEVLIEYADQAMYLAKNSGRNAIRVFNPDISAQRETT